MSTEKINEVSPKINKTITKLFQQSNSLQIESDSLSLQLGTGILSWPPSERDSGRYGLVTLWTEPINSPLAIKHVVSTRIPLNIVHVKGKRVYCDVIATVIENRKFLNIGDGARGFFATRVEPGTEVILGRGILWYGDKKSVGITPVEPRPHCFDPGQLHKVVDQLVMLSVIPNPI